MSDSSLGRADDLSGQISAQVFERTGHPLAPSERFARLVLLVGASLLAIALGADLIGVRGIVGSWRPALVWAGAATLLIGAVLEATLGQRHLLTWFKALVLDIPGVLKFLGITVQLGLLVIVVRSFDLENYALSRFVMPLTLYGFIIHHFLPGQYRLPFFLVLSLGAISGVLGLANAAWLVGIGLVLIGICHLPVSFSFRVVLLLAAGVSLAVSRAGLLSVPWPPAIWPILGSMFMFRLLVYLYDLKHNKAPISVTRALSYFFLLPNVAFPLFPVVDYATYCRTRYDRDPYEIYQTGLVWMCWGVIHLLLYRYINYNWVIAPEDVTNQSTLLQYALSNFLLILRISGQFHLIVGILHLFGFNLPRVMRLYCLSSSFTEFFERANVYWKDFIQKVFFFPAYFRLRTLDNTVRLGLSILFAFFMTWLLHSYQWFWIRGSFLLSAPDVLFWSTLAFLVLANSLYGATHGRKRALNQSAAPLREIVLRSLRTAGTFAVIVGLWSLWISPSVSEWLALLAGAGVTLYGLAVALFAATLTFLVALLVSDRISRWAPTANPISFWKSGVTTGGLVLFLLMIGSPMMRPRFAENAEEVIRDLRVARLSGPDADLLTRGYYENLTSIDRFNTQLWEIYMKRPDNWPRMQDSEAGRPTGDLLAFELVPSTRILFHGAPFSTNRWGMRDKDYDKHKPADTYRIALLGGSHPAGSGVGDQETFEWVLEDRLNREHAGRTYAKYEILNFALGGYSPIQDLIVLEKKALDFEPDVILYTAFLGDLGRTIIHLVEGVRSDVHIPYDRLNEIVQRAGLRQETPKSEAERRLRPFSEELVTWAYRRIAQLCRERGVLPVFVYLPALKPGRNDPKDAANLRGLADQVGFIVLDLSDLYRDLDVQSLQVAEWDWHPNARGHRLIAERLYAALRENAKTIPMGFDSEQQTP